MRIEIVSTGDEVITGNIDDTNATFLSQELAECGLEVNRRHTAGDNLEELEAVFSEISERNALVLVTGGLGPTNDDLTALAISHVANAPLCLHQEWLDRIQEIFKQRGRVMTSSNRKQAMLPQGCLLINNPVGTACGFAVKHKSALFIFAPGVPSELKAMWRNSIKEMVVAAMNSSTIPHLSTCKYTMMGVGESNLADIINPLPLPKGITFGDRAMHPFIELKLIGRDVHPELMTQCYNIVDRLLSRYIICQGPYDLMSRLKRMQFVLPRIHVVDVVCHGLLSIELQKLNISILSSMIINVELHESDKTQNRPPLDAQQLSNYECNLDSNLPEDNYICLLPSPIYAQLTNEDYHVCENEEGNDNYSYTLSFKLSCQEAGSPRVLQGALRFDFFRATSEYVTSVRHRTFLTLLCIAELYKLTIDEPLVLPDDCNVELLKFEDTKPHTQPIKIGKQAATDLQSMLQSSIEQMSKLSNA